jgi:hypothetical protein
MDNFINFEPNSEDERFFFETHRNLSIATSKLIRSLPQEHRLFALKEGNPSDTSLMALYLWALRNEDYETCQVAKELLIERGIDIPL